MLTRRATMAFAASLGLCPAACRSSPEGRVRDVVAAGQPAALLIWAVARDRLAGWPRRPSADSLRGLTAEAATLPELGALAGPGRPADPAAIAALRPSLVLDYGDTDPLNRVRGEQVRAGLDVDWRLLDGALTRIPDAFREAGRLLDARERGVELGTMAEQVLTRWRAAPPGPSFYYARGADGLETGFRGALATEVLEGAGWTNVAEGASDIGRVDPDQIAAWDPEALVTLDAGFARKAQADPVWRRRRNGAMRRILLFPDRPFGWIDRPPSVNRLLGCAWLASPEGGVMTISLLSRRLYGMAASEVLQPKWIV